MHWGPKSVFPVSLQCERRGCKTVDTYLFFTLTTTTLGKSRRAVSLNQSSKPITLYVQHTHEIWVSVPGKLSFFGLHARLNSLQRPTSAKDTYVFLHSFITYNWNASSITHQPTFKIILYIANRKTYFLESSFLKITSVKVWLCRRIFTCQCYSVVIYIKLQTGAAYSNLGNF